MARRRLLTAELLAIGTELTLGETRDTNSGDLARDLTGLGVDVGRISALPDTFDLVTGAFRDALARSDLVLSTGGLGPTPDDLTREAIAAVCAAQPTIDPVLERWLRDLFERRGAPMSEANLKQAWLIPGATALGNANGTAPGWWVERPDGRVIVALPGPPREMRPMWSGDVLPRLHARGLGADRASETLRLTGIGESALAELLGEAVLRAPQPQVATYARADAVDVRVSAVGTAGRPAHDVVRETVSALLPRLERYVFARGAETWADALGRRLAGRTLGVHEVGTAGQLTALLGGAPWLAFAEVHAAERAMAATHADVRRSAEGIRERAGVDVGLSVRARERAGDTAVNIAVALGGETTGVTRTAFLGGEQGRRRAALLACAELWARLGSAAP